MILNKFNYLFSFLIIFFGFFQNSYAQTCSKEASFKDISLECIEKNRNGFTATQKRLEKQQLDLEKLRTGKAKDSEVKRAEFQLAGLVDMRSNEIAQESVGTTFFFKTSSGFLGKFVIRSAEVRPSGCTLFLEATTYSNRGVIDASTNFSIINDANSWNIDNGSFDSSGKPDFVLKREHGACVFKMQDGVAFKFGKTNEAIGIEGNQILMYASYLLVGLAVFLVMRTVFADEDKFKAGLSLEDADEDEKKQVPKDFILKYSRPFFKRYFSPVVQGMKYKKKIREKYKRPLAASGMNKFLTPEDFYAFKLFLILGFPMVYVLGGKFMEIEVELSYIPILMLIGFFYPNQWIKEKANARRKEVLLNMPFIVDMLALSVEAGLDFTAAIQRVIEKAPPSALVEEFEIFLREIKVGSSRAEALRSLSWRIDSLPIASFCATLIAADSVGTGNLAPILKSLSAEIRQKRSTDIEKKGAQAATKVLFPMLFIILPAVVVIIAAPFVIEFMGGG